VDNPNAILFIDEIHTLIGPEPLGRTLDASNLLKPASFGRVENASAPIPTTIAGVFEKDTRCRALRRSTCLSLRSRRRSRSCVAEIAFEPSRYQVQRQCVRAPPAGRALHQRPAPARQGIERHRRGGAAQKILPKSSRRKSSQERRSKIIARSAHPAASVSQETGGAQN